LKKKWLWKFILVGLFVMTLSGCKVVMNYHLDDCEPTTVIIDSSDTSNDAVLKHGTGNTDGLSARYSFDTNSYVVCANRWFRGEGYNAGPNNSWYAAKYYIEASDHDDISPLASSSKEMTLSGWFKTSYSNGTIIAKSGDSSNSKEYRVFLEGGTLKVSFWNQYGSPVTFDIAPSVADNSWHAFAVTAKISGNNLQVKKYLDGDFKGTENRQNFVYCTNTSGSLFIGAMAWDSANPTNYFNGYIDELLMIDDVQRLNDLRDAYQEMAAHKNGDGSSRSCCGSEPQLQCFNDDFNRSSLDSDWAVSSSGGSFGVPRIVNGRLRLTDSSTKVATAASLLRLFPGAGNKIVYEFDHYAYSGNGADGIAVALSDAAVTPVPGGYGGSLGYAQRCGINGFAGGWLGLGIDEFGNFCNDGECRGDGGRPSARVLDSVAVRGSGSGLSGYLLHGTSGVLSPPIDNSSSSTPEYGHRYRVTIDHTDNVHAYVSVERDTGSGYQMIIPIYDAMTQSGQAAVPVNWLISMTGSTGDSRNIHEIDDLQVCATYMGAYNSIDHYRLQHDGSALTCAPENIRVQACLDRDCSVEFAGNIEATLSPSGWVGGNVQTFLSGDILQLWHTAEESANLSIVGDRSEFIAVNSPRCFIGATEQPDCTLLFHDSGFIFDVPDHVADTTQTVTLAAVRKDITTEQCVPGFQNVTKDISFWSEYLNPGSGTLPVQMNSSSIASISPGSSYSLDFDTQGEVEIEIAYADVGQMSLNALYQGSGDDDGLVMTGVDSFITRPDYFLVTVPGNPGATSAAGDVFTKAGETFSIEVSARNASGNVTPNYGQEAVPESVQLSQDLVEPTGQHNPPLLGSFALFGTNCNGNHAPGYVCGEFSWNEVGIIDLLPAVADGSYLGTGNVVGTASGNVGRFTPDHFVTSVTNNGVFQDACSGFSYSGQPFSYASPNFPEMSITAVASSGNTTVNYRDDFVKLTDPAIQIVMPSVTSDTSQFGVDLVSLLNLTWAPAASTLVANNDGTLTFTLGNDQFTYVREANALIAPFNSAISLPVNSVTDSDGISANDLPRIFSPTGAEIRYGRMQLQNAYGSETLPLTIPILTESYDGTSFIPNSSDACTSYDSSNLQLDTYQGNLVDGDTLPSGGGTFVAGMGNNAGVNSLLSLSAPGGGHDGSVNLTYDLDAAGLGWLKPGGINPTDTATFGIFKGNPRLIYMRESVW